MNRRLFSFSIKNAFRRKGILAIAIVGTGLGTALMATLVSLSNGMDAELTRTLNLVASEITVTAQDTDSISLMFGGGTAFPESYSDDIEDIDGVKSIKPTVTASIPSSSIESTMPIGTSLNGVNLDIDQELEGPTTKVIEGETINDKYDIIAGKQIGSRPENMVQIEIGDEIVVPINDDTMQEDMDVTEPSLMPNILPTPGGNTQNEPAEYEGETVTLKVVGIFETGNRFDDGSFIGSIDAAREIAGLENDEVTSLAVEAEDTELVEGIAEEIETLFEDEEIPVSTTLAKDVLGELNDTLGIFRTFILVISLVAAIAGGMSIFIIMLMSVIERLQEFGIFKATGWSNTNIISSVIVESITVAILGSTAGLLIGYVIGKVINNQLGSDIALFNLELVALILLFGVVMGVLGGVLPAIKAARVSPIETLQSV